jgi:hypothetical protein
VNKGGGEAWSKGEETAARTELTEGGGRMAVAAPISVASMALLQPEWTNGHRGEVEAFVRGRVERETV